MKKLGEFIPNFKFPTSLGEKKKKIRPANNGNNEKCENNQLELNSS